MVSPSLTSSNNHSFQPVRRLPCSPQANIMPVVHTPNRRIARPSHINRLHIQAVTIHSSAYACVEARFQVRWWCSLSEHFCCLLICHHSFSRRLDDFFCRSVDGKRLISAGRVDWNGAKATEDGSHELVASDQAELFVGPIRLQMSLA